MTIQRGTSGYITNKTVENTRYTLRVTFRLNFENPSKSPDFNTDHFPNLRRVRRDEGERGPSTTDFRPEGRGVVWLLHGITVILIFIVTPLLRKVDLVSDVSFPEK